MSNGPGDPRLKRALRALGQHKVDEAVAKVRAIIGPPNMPASEPLAQAALDKMHDGIEPTPDELVALEIVIRLLRPVVLSRGCQLDDLPDMQGHNLYTEELRSQWTTFRDRIRPVVCSVGRIETAKGQHMGTGFLVAPGLLATNRHVLGALTFGAEVLPPGSARVVFKQEAGLRNDPTNDVLPITGVAAKHDRLDLVLLKVPESAREPVEFEQDPPTEGSGVVTIGYPADDQRNNPLFLGSVFQGIFGVKRAAVGELLGGTAPPSIYHDCSTTQGNSGSPIFGLDSARVVGIHRSGFFMFRNEGLEAGEVRALIQTAGV